jgi:hypothetical protein
MTISPAQAVWDAYEQILKNECVVTDTDKKALAAALSIIADQVVPLPPRFPCNRWIDGYLAARKKVRAKILAIAAELETL